MPIVGFISQDGKSDQPEGMGRCSFEYALQLCEERDEAFPYPYPLLKGIIESIQDRGEYISATSILHCLRGEYLKRNVKTYATVEQMYPAFRGTLFHALLEANPPKNAKIETKVLRKYRGIEIGGTFDSLLIFEDRETKKHVIQDWKTTENLPKYDSPYSSHIAQVNLYRWLLDLDPNDVEMEVHYFSMKGHKVCKLKDGSGVGRGGRMPSNQHWSNEQVERFLDDRLVRLKASFDSKVPMPYALVTEDEKWECEYCPVRQHCADLAKLEAEAVFRKRSGLPPVGTPADEAAEWSNIYGTVVARLPKAYK